MFPAVPLLLRLLVGVPFLLSAVRVSESADSKMATKRGLNGLTGVPGVLYSQYSPHFQPVPVPHPFPVPVPQPVPIQVPKPFPVTVHKTVGLPVPVGVPVPVHVPVPRPYPVPVPLNLAQGNSPLGAFGPFGPFGGTGGSYPGLGGFGGPFHSSPFGSSAPGGALGKLGYGLGVYASGPSALPLAHPSLAAAFGAHPPSLSGDGLLGLPKAAPLADPLAVDGHHTKY